MTVAEQHLSTEDETGLINVIVSAGCWKRFRSESLATALVVSGRLERSEGVVNVIAEHLQPLAAPGRSTSRNFR